MEVTIIKCNSCGYSTEDIHGTIGWVTSDPLRSITVSGGRTKDGRSDPFRYLSCPHTVHFCSIECFIEFLYFSDGGFNNANTLEEKLELIDTPRRRAVIEAWIDNTQKILEGVGRGVVE